MSIYFIFFNKEAKKNNCSWMGLWTIEFYKEQEQVEPKFFYMLVNKLDMGLKNKLIYF